MNATEQIRRRMLAAHTRTRRRVLPRMREPSDLAYRADLLLVARNTQKLIRVELKRFFDSRTDAARADGIADELRGLFQRLRIRAAAQTAARAIPIATQFVKRTVEANRKAMNDQMSTVIKIDPFKDNAGLERTMRARARTNVELIKSIPAELIDDVEAVVAPRVISGIRVEEIMKRVQERFDVSESRAQLIARDQVGKFNGELTQERHESLGVNEYVWSTSQDSRVRPDHADLNGRAFSYDQPPVVDQKSGRTANPGEDYQCRCQALPKVSSLLDALGVGDEELTIEED